MRLARPTFLSKLLSITLLFMLVLPVGMSVQAQSTPEDSSYTSADFGFTIDWSGDWELTAEESFAVELTNGAGDAIWIEGFPGTTRPEDLVVPQEGETSVLNSSSGTPVRDIFENQVGEHVYVESYQIDGGEVTILLEIYSQPEQVLDTLEQAREEITLNGDSVVTGSPMEVSDGDDETDTTRTGQTSDPDETPEATDPDTGDGTSYTGPMYGYTLEWDPKVWTMSTEVEGPGSDGLVLLGEYSTLSIVTYDRYGSDPLACLEGEAHYYGQENQSIENWEPVLDANGEELRYESDDLAWGVFSLTYTYESGAVGDLYDYISCQPIPGQDAVLTVLLSADPNAYNDELDNTFDVLDTLQFGEAPDSDDTTDLTGTEIPETPEPRDTPVADNDTIEIDTNLVGSEYRSANFGFTATIPLEWQVVDESNDATNEMLSVSNGTSLVTLWATSDYSGSVAGCVDFAAESSGLNLQLDEDAEGGEFRGVYRDEAFGNFVYEDNGVKMMYFIKCQEIPGTDGFLILTQAVEHDLFAAQRSDRAEIENSIVMPGE